MLYPRMMASGVVALCIILSSSVPAAAHITDKDQAMYDRCRNSSETQNMDFDKIIARCSTCANYLVNRSGQESGNDGIALKMFGATCLMAQGMAEHFDGQDTLANEHLLVSEVGFKAVIRDTDDATVIAKAKKQIATINSIIQ